MPNMLDFDRGEIEIPCPKCGHKTAGTIGRFKRDRQFSCAGCGATVVPDFSEFDKGARAVEDQIKKMFRR